MAPTRKMLFCFALCFCLLNSAFSMPQPFAPEEEEEDNEIKFDDAPEEIPEEKLLAEKDEPELFVGGEDEKELEWKDEKAEEEKELEAEEGAENDLTEENEEEEIAEKELEEEAKEDEEKRLEGADKEDETAEDDVNTKENEFPKSGGGIIFPDIEDKEEIPAEESFHEDEEETDSKEWREQDGEFYDEGMGVNITVTAKPGFFHRAYNKVKTFFKRIGK